MTSAGTMTLAVSTEDWDAWVDRPLFGEVIGKKARSEA